MRGGITRGFDHHLLWAALDKAFEGFGKPVVKGETLHYTGTHEAKQIAVSAVLQLQHERTLMSNRDFNRLFGSIATIGLLVFIVAVVVYFLELPIFNQFTVSWLLFYGIVAAAIAAAALILRTIWNET